MLQHKVLERKQNNSICRVSVWDITATPRSEYTEMEVQLLRVHSLSPRPKQPQSGLLPVSHTGKEAQIQQKMAGYSPIVHAEVWQFDQRRQRSMPEMQEYLLIINFYCGESP